MKGKWIPVKDKLPEMFKSVLVCTNANQIGISCVMSNGQMDNYICEVNMVKGEVFEEITHWMYLPKPFHSNPVKFK